MNHDVVRVLLIDDSAQDAQGIVTALESAGHAVTHRRVDSEAALLDALGAPWDVVFAEFDLAALPGLQALQIVASHRPLLPVIFVAHSRGEDRALAAMRAGARDYVLKSELHQLAPAARTALARAHGQRRVEAAAAPRLQSATRLTGGIAHDLNNALGVIRGYAEMIGLGAGASVRSDLASIEEAAEVAARHCRHLTLLGPVYPARAEPVDVNERVRGLEKLLGRLLPRQTQLQSILAGDLWLAHVDGLQFEQLLVSLMLDVSPGIREGEPLVLETGNVAGDRALGDCVALSLSWSGPGFRPVTPAPGVVIDSVSALTGLDPLAAHHIVGEAGGRLSVEGGPRGGMKLSVLLPRAAAQVTP